MEGSAIVESEVRRNEYEVEEKCACFLLGVRPLLLTFSYDNRSLVKKWRRLNRKIKKIVNEYLVLIKNWIVKYDEKNIID